MWSPRRGGADSAYSRSCLQKRAAIEPIEHRLQVPAGERRYRPDDMADRAAGEPSERLDLRAIPILCRPAPLAKSRRLEMLDRNRILQPSIALRQIGQDDELDAGRRVGHGRQDRAVRLAVTARLRSVGDHAQPGHERTARSRSAAWTTSSGRIPSGQRKSPGAHTLVARAARQVAGIHGLARNRLLRHGCDRIGSVGP